MLVKDDFYSYQSYILEYIVEREKHNFIYKIMNSKRKLKKIIHDNLFNIRINKQMIQDFIYSYFFNPDIEIENSVPFLNSNICSLNTFYEDSDLRVSVSQKPDLKTIYITFSSKNNLPIPITINLNGDLTYKGDIERNRIIVEKTNDIFLLILSLFYTF